MYRHIEIDTVQSAKKVNGPCGDVVYSYRDEFETLIILADGLGSGSSANIAAHMNASRALELLKQGVTVRNVFERLVGSLSDWREFGKPFSALTIVKIINDGLATVLTYDNPYPILISHGEAVMLPSHALIMNDKLCSEFSAYLKPGDRLLFCSDGVTQAGIGNGLSHGLGLGGLAQAINRYYSSKELRTESCLKYLFNHVKELDGYKNRDDITLVSANCRQGKVLNIFTGPPKNKCDDYRVVQAFNSCYGRKVIAGATTSNIVAKVVEKKVDIEMKIENNFTPPKYYIEGFDLVCEGAITLNQVYNLIDENLQDSVDNSASIELAKLLQESDLIRFYVGTSINPANGDIVFTKQGILQRRDIIKLLCDKLKTMEKTVVLNEF